MSFWITWGLTIVFAVYAVLSPWMMEWTWPLYFSGGEGDRGTVEIERTGILGFPVWGGMFVVTVTGLLALSVFARFVRSLPSSLGWIVFGVTIAVGVVVLTGVALHITDVSRVAGQVSFGGLTHEEQFTILGGGVNAEAGSGQGNAVAALLIGVVPLGLAVGLRGPMLLAMGGAMLCTGCFLVPWESAQAFYTDRIEVHHYAFTIDSNQGSWLFLMGALGLIVLTTGAFFTRGVARTILAWSTLPYLVALFVGLVWFDEYHSGEEEPIEHDLADAIHVWVHSPAWPGPWDLLIGGALFLTAAALWQWGASGRGRRVRHTLVTRGPASSTVSIPRPPEAPGGVR